MISKKLGVSIIIAILALIIAIFAISQQTTIRNIGLVQTIGVEAYTSENLTEPLTFIDWETVAPGENKNFMAWIKNAGNTAVTLEMWTSNWQPANATDYIVLTWNYNDTVISASETIPTVFTLNVYPNVTGITNFSFDVWIKGVVK